MNPTSHFIMRYYYFLEDETESLERLVTVFNQNSLISFDKNLPAKFLDQAGVFYTLNDASGKMNILTIKTLSEVGSWATTLMQLQEWETEAELSSDELMGKLTVLVGPQGKWTELLEDAATLLSYQEAGSIGLEYRPLVRLSVDRKQEASFLYSLDDPESISIPFLTRRMPMIHGSVIRLQTLDGILKDRNFSIRGEKEELEHALIRILHTKLVMNQVSILASEDLEREIEGLATAFGKVLGDQSLISDGINRLNSMLDSLKRQIVQEPVRQMYLNMLQQMNQTYQERLVELRHTYEELNLVRENYKAAIEVVQSKIEVMNNRTNIVTQQQIKGLLEVNTAMQKQSLVFQYAAGLIEFIIIAYYSHTLWSHLEHTAYTVIPSWIQFIVVMLFSGSAVLVTHLLAEYMQGDIHVRRKLILTSILLLLIFILTVVGSVIARSQGVTH